MSKMRRHQISLTDDQLERLRFAARANGVAVTDIVRRAVDAFLRDDAERSSALARTFGAVPDVDVTSRSDWERPRR